MTYQLESGSIRTMLGGFETQPSNDQANIA